MLDRLCKFKKLLLDMIGFILEEILESRKLLMEIIRNNIFLVFIII